MTDPLDVPPLPGQALTKGWRLRSETDGTRSLDSAGSVCALASREGRLAAIQEVEMDWKRVGDYAMSAAKFGVAVAGVAVMAALHVWANNPNAGTQDLAVAAVTAVVVWLVPNKPLLPAPAPGGTKPTETARAK